MCSSTTLCVIIEPVMPLFLNFTLSCLRQRTCGERGDGAERQNQTRASRNPQVQFMLCAAPRLTVTSLQRQLVSATRCVSMSSAVFVLAGPVWCPAEVVRPSPTGLASAACRGPAGGPCTYPSWRVRKCYNNSQKAQFHHGSIKCLNAWCRALAS